MYNSRSRRRRSNAPAPCTNSAVLQICTTLVRRARKHREARQGCPIWAVRCMWDHRHGHVFTTCFVAGHPTSGAQPSPAGKPEHQLQFLRLFAPFRTALTQGDHWPLGPHNAPHCARFARWLGHGWALVLGLTGATDCGLKSESRAQNGLKWAYLFSRAPTARNTKGRVTSRGLRRTR